MQVVPQWMGVSPVRVNWSVLGLGRVPLMVVARGTKCLMGQHEF